MSDKFANTRTSYSSSISDLKLSDVTSFFRNAVDEVISLKESFGEIEKQVIAAGEIIKCHRAYLVNLRFISAIQNSDIILDNSERLPVSRNQMKKVQQEFLKYYKKS